MLLGLEDAEELGERIVELVNNSFLERNDRVIRNRDVLWANDCAAFGDVAIADAVFTLEIFDPIGNIQRVHFQCRGVHEVARADELIVLVVISKNVAYVLAEEALDALAELLYAFHILLLHAPCAISGIWLARREGRDRLLHSEVG